MTLVFYTELTEGVQGGIMGGLLFGSPASFLVDDKWSGTPGHICLGSLVSGEVPLGGGGVSYSSGA